MGSLHNVARHEVAGLLQRYCDLLPLGNKFGGELPRSTSGFALHIQRQDQSSCCRKRMLHSVFAGSGACAFEVIGFGANDAEQISGSQHAKAVGKTKRKAAFHGTQVPRHSFNQKKNGDAYHLGTFSNVIDCRP